MLTNDNTRDTMLGKVDMGPNPGGIIRGTPRDEISIRASDISLLAANWFGATWPPYKITRCPSILWSYFSTNFEVVSDNKVFYYSKCLVRECLQIFSAYFFSFLFPGRHPAIVWSLMKLNIEIYIQKLHYYQKVPCVKTFIKRLFIFCVAYFQKNLIKKI